MKTFKKELETIPPHGSYRRNHIKPKLIGVLLSRKSDELVRQVSLSLTQAIDAFHVVTLGDLNEASRSLVETDFDLLILDSNTYLNLSLTSSPNTFKVMVEEDFSFLENRFELESRPFIYDSRKNLLKIRGKSVGNTRFLYEIFNVVLNPPKVKLVFGGSPYNDNYIKKISNETITYFPFINFEMEYKKIYTKSFFDVDVTIERSEKRNKIIKIKNKKNRSHIPYRISFDECSEEENIDKFSNELSEILKNENYIDLYSSNN